MSNYPRIKPYFSVIAHSSNQIELRMGVWNHVSYTLEDESNAGRLHQFISMLDGSHSIKEITDEIAMSRSQAEAIMDQLNTISALENQSSSALDYYLDIYAPLFRGKDIAIPDASKRIIYILAEEELATEIKMQLITNTAINDIHIIQKTDPLMQLINNQSPDWLHNGLALEQALHDLANYKDSFFILAFDQINPNLAHKFNKISVGLNINWIHAAIDGPFIFIGPTFEPDSTACYECFETRVGINLREYQSYQKYKSALAKQKLIQKSHFPMRKLLVNLLISHLLFEILNYYLTKSCFTKNKVMSIYLPTMEIAFNEFLPLSHCQTCGSTTHRDDHQLYFDVQKLLEDNA